MNGYFILEYMAYCKMLYKCLQGTHGPRLPRDEAIMEEKSMQLQVR